MAVDNPTLICGSEQPGDPTSVYRYYDRAGVLIYVGMTKTGILRNKQHNADKAWWPRVARQEVEHFHSRESARAREVFLIRRFNPPFNVDQNRNSNQIRAAYEACADEMMEPLDEKSLKRRISSGEPVTVRLIRLTVKRGCLAFATDPRDASIVSFVKPNSGALVLSGCRPVGRVVSVTRMLDSDRVARIVTNIKVDGPNQAVAELKPVSLKHPVVLTIRRIRM